MLGIFNGLYALVMAVVTAGSLSVGPLQFAEVNVLYVPGVASDPDFSPPDPCVVDVAILDGQGNQAKFQEFSLEPGQSGHLSVAYGDLKGGGQAGGGDPGSFHGAVGGARHLRQRSELRRNSLLSHSGGRGRR